MSDFCEVVSTDLVLVQGDVLNLTLTFEDTYSNISKVYFTSMNLDVKKELAKESDTTYTLEIADTSEWTPQTISFDITIVFEDDSKFTTIYNRQLKILPKRNGLDCL